MNNYLFTNRASNLSNNMTLEIYSNLFKAHKLRSKLILIFLNFTFIKS